MTPGRDLAERFGLEEAPDLEPRYNIAPTQLVAVIRLDRDTLKRRLVLVKWGLVPYWSKDASTGQKMINARAESAAQKPAFRSAFKFKRCLVLADGFYQWKKGKVGKQPYLFKMADGSPFAFAGLWERWTSPEREVIESCALLTTEANEIMKPIHDRMPVILHPKNFDVWLDPKIKDPSILKPLLHPYPSNEMVAFPVSDKVNKASYDGPYCVEAVSVEE